MDPVEVTDWILRRNNAGCWLNMRIEEFIDQYKRALDNDRREQIRTQWTEMLPWMSAGILKYMDFQSYYDQCTGANLDLRPAEDIIREIKMLHGKEVEG